jgi:hypothetical protein
MDLPVPRRSAHLPPSRQFVTHASGASRWF